MSGLFITFEGLDGSGKSTHLDWVSERLRARGVRHVVTKEPGGTPLADRIRALFLDREQDSLDGITELLLVFAARRHHLTTVIEPALRSGQHVLCDRFSDSTYAYQGAGRGLEWTEIAEVDRLATGNRRPDRTLLFDLAPEEAFRRRRGDAAASEQADRIDLEGLDFYSRVRDGFLRRAAEEPQRFISVDSGGSKEQTRLQIEQVFTRLFVVSGGET